MLYSCTHSATVGVKGLKLNCLTGVSLIHYDLTLLDARDAVPKCVSVRLSVCRDPVLCLNG